MRTAAIFLLTALLAGCGGSEPEVVKRARLDTGEPPMAGTSACDRDWRNCEPGQRRWND